MGLASRVLIADDHEAMRRGLRSLLGEAGFNVVDEASNGREAVKKTRSESPDLVILDVSMPEMNGLAAAREISRENPKVKILIYTMHEPNSLREEALRAGAHGVIGKCDPVSDLVAAIRSTLDSISKS